MFDWKPAQWRPSIARLARNVCPQVLSRHTWNLAVDVATLADAYYDAIGRHVKMLRKGYSLCRFRTQVEAIDSVGCACSPGSSGTCFADHADGNAKAEAASQVPSTLTSVTK